MSVFFNPVIGILHNTALNRWHPVVFSESPLPGPDEPGKPIRHKSRMHHTAGFATREEAVANATGDTRTRVATANGAGPETVRVFTDEDLPWDGADVPAVVVFFPAL